MLVKTAPFCALICLLSISPAFAQGPPPPPQPLGNPPVPAGNPITIAKTNLGKALFWDEQLSSTRTISCGTCHQPVSGGSDPRSAIGDSRSTHPGPDGVFDTADDITASPGVILNYNDGSYGLEDFFGMTEQVTGRYAPTAINAAFAPELFWDGRAETTFVDPVSGETVLDTGAALESQAVGPPLSGAEMSHQSRDWPAVAERVAGARPLALSPLIPADLTNWIANRNYPALFDEAFGDDEVTPARIIMAIATYERTLISNQAPIDAFFGGNNNALTPQEQQGLQLFRTSDCVACHGGNRFTDDRFHYIGVRPQTDDLGRFNVTGVNTDRGRMKTPTLRNVELRGEFMHNGRLGSLADVVDFYDRGGDFDAPNKNNNVRPLNLTDEEKAALVAFLSRPLTDPRVANETGPFSRPELFSESAHQPIIGSDIVEDNEGNLPNIVAIEPALGGNPSFTVGLSNVPAERLVYLVIDDSPITSASGLPDASSVRMFFELTTEDEGYTSRTIPLPGGRSLDNTKLYGKWFISGDGTIGESASFEATIFGETAGLLSAPTNLTATDGTSSSQIILSWDEVTNATTYDIYRGATDSFVDAIRIGQTNAPDDTEFNDTNVEYDSAYFYWIVAINDSEASAPSESDSGSTYNLDGFDLTATDSTYSIQTTLTWLPPAPALTYEIYRGTTSNPAEMVLLDTTSSTTYSDMTGTGAREYFYRVIAFAAGSFVGNSIIDSGTRALPMPSSVTASVGTYRDRIAISWIGDSDATGYRILRSSSLGESGTQIADVSTELFDDYSAIATTDYYYSIVAHNQFGSSAASYYIHGYRAISPPTNVKSDQGSELDRVTVSWTAAQSVSSYAIFRSLTNNFAEASEISIISNKSSFTDTDVEEGAIYYYWVASIDEEDERVLEIADVTLGSSGELIPDLLIGKTTSKWKGDAIYNTSGAEQSLGQLSRRYRKIEIHLRSENDGTIDDTFTYNGSSGNRFFKYTYVRTSPSAKNLTASMKAGIASSGPVSPSSYEQLSVKIKSIRSKQKNKRKIYRHTGYIRLISELDSTKTDCVKIKAKSRY